MDMDMWDIAGPAGAIPLMSCRGGVPTGARLSGRDDGRSSCRA